MFEFTKAHVLHALPPVLRQIALNPDYTEEACQMLWELGRVDPRPLNQYPEHAIRILSDLAGYDVAKPVFYSEKVLNCLERWIDEPGLPHYQHSPLVILDGLLAKQTSFQRVRGYSLQLGTVPLDLSLIEDLRTRALNCIARCLAHTNPRVVTKALESLHKVIAPPVVLFGRAIDQDEYDQWNTERLRACALLKSFVERTVSPALLAHTAYEFKWLAQHATPAEVSSAVREGLALIPDSLEIRVIRALTRGFFDIGMEDVENLQQLQQNYLEDVTKDFLARFEGNVGVSKLEEIIEDIDRAGIESGHGQFFFLVARTDHALGASLIEHVLAHADCRLARYVPSIIQAVRLNDVGKALGAISQIVRGRRSGLQGSVAYAYAWSDWLSNPRDEDFEFLGELLTSGDARAKYHAMQAIRRLRNSTPSGEGVSENEEKVKLYYRGIELLLNVDIGGDPNLAEGLCEALDPTFGIPPGLLTAEQARVLLQKLIQTCEITHQSYHMSRVLEFFARRSPMIVLDFLIARIAFAVGHGDDSGDYNPIPFGVEGIFASVDGTPTQVEMLRRIRDERIKAEGLEAYWLTKLFRIVAQGYGRPVLEILSELQQDADVAKYRLIASILSEAPSSFVFTEKEFCAGVLESAKRLSEDIYNLVGSALAGSVMSGTFGGTPGQPSPKYVNIHEKATALTSEFKARPAVADFYRRLSEGAKSTIDRFLERDEEEFLE